MQTAPPTAPNDPQTLRERIRIGGPLGPGMTLRLLRPIAEQIDHAIKKRKSIPIVHPDNLRLSGVKGYEQLTLVEAPAPIPRGYAAGDPTNGAPPAVFSFGATLYLCLTGQDPDPDDPTSAPPSMFELHPALDAPILCCLEPNPADRFSTAAEALAALQDAVARTRSVGSSMWRDPEETFRERLTSGLGLLGVGIAVLGLFLALRCVGGPTMNGEPPHCDGGACTSPNAPAYTH